MRVVALEATEYFKFSTRRFSTGASYTLAGTPSCHVYEANNTTQITAGITLTADYDAITGLNDIAIACTAANGYEAGKTYYITIGAGTVDSVSVVGQVVGEFRVETVAERAQRLIMAALYPSGVEITATTTSNSTTAINLTDVVDAQTPDDALVGLVLVVLDATDGRIEIVETTACTSKVATVQQISDGGAMSFTVAVGDTVIIQGVAPLRPTTNGRKLNIGQAATGVADVNVTYINETVVLGVGTSGDKWRA